MDSKNKQMSEWNYHVKVFCFVLINFQSVFLSNCLVFFQIWVTIEKNLERFTNLRVILAQGPC